MTDQDSNQDRLRAAFAVPAEKSVSSADCLPDETIWKAVHAGLDAVELQRVLDHTAGCAACAESWRMAHAVGNEAGIRKIGALRAFPSRRAVFALSAVAATILLVLFVAPTLNDWPGSIPADEFRDAPAVRLESLLDETEIFSRNALQLRWTGGPEGTLYTVELVDENLAVLARSEPQEPTEYTVPPDKLEGLPADATLYWRIDAVLPDATRISSGVFLLRLQ